LRQAELAEARRQAFEARMALRAKMQKELKTSGKDADRDLLSSPREEPSPTTLAPSPKPPPRGNGDEGPGGAAKLLEKASPPAVPEEPQVDEKATPPSPSVRDAGADGASSAPRCPCLFCPRV
jgi:hypothetical protein